MFREISYLRFDALLGAPGGKSAVKSALSMGVEGEIVINEKFARGDRTTFSW
jgi:hypothetical protein